MTTRSTMRRVRRVLAVLAVTGVAVAAAPEVSAETNYPFHYDTECKSASLSMSVSAGAGILTLAGVGFSHTYEIPAAFCSADYTPGVYWEEPAAYWEDPPIPHFDPPTPNGPMTPEFQAYLDRLDYVHWQVRAHLGDPAPGAVNWNLVETAATRVVAFLDAANHSIASVTPTRVEGWSWDQGFLTWLNGGNHGFAGPTTLANGDQVWLNGTWHPLYHNFNVINFSGWSGEFAGAISENAAVGAGCASGGTGHVQGYGTPGDEANLLGQEWKASIAFGCGLLAGTSAGEGGAGGLFVAAGASVTAQIGPASS
ncbi:MAG TPA: hypothetical protein VJM33_04445 [Microthrixaceae bacterium]|nr:hypothetical protein [Microthrixaceae bacterium]